MAMALRVGCDIVSIGVFRKRLADSGDLLPERLFHPGERSGAGVERLAGLFAAKEAALKAFGWPAGAWLRLYIEHDASGAPFIRLLEPDPGIQEISLSISHAGDTALAVVAALIK